MIISDLQITPGEDPYVADITVTLGGELTISGLHLGRDRSGSYFLALPTVTDEGGSSEKIVDFVSTSLTADIYLKAVNAFAE